MAARKASRSFGTGGTLRGFDHALPSFAGRSRDAALPASAAFWAFADALAGSGARADLPSRSACPRNRRRVYLASLPSGGRPAGPDPSMMCRFILTILQRILRGAVRLIERFHWFCHCIAEVC